jgi:hypothetical protein
MIDKDAMIAHPNIIVELAAQERRRVSALYRMQAGQLDAKSVVAARKVKKVKEVTRQKGRSARV